MDGWMDGWPVTQWHFGPSRPRQATLSRTSIWRCRQRKSVAVKKFRKASLDAPDDRQALEAPDTAS